ncbi:sensor histidine kinase [Synoicihabitans lomoniglobus]|uniref:HAMP domain-containing protein n=1 Tax=Synoicihabitans lomoniglobus TaxID=2909285 RepID=A0AAE9ZVA1_9BACT|nr:HAMP domain-containing protein [Opitutaceae bacterium LMO-M01]WED65700.1 HAMP domain-containing protein [Opitutaceae bacterium LMO-M01]
MKPLHLHFNVRTWLQIGLLSSITGVAIWIGSGLFVSLRRVILDGFDKQLTSPSVVVAAFIEPEDHAWLAERRNIHGLAYAEKEDVFYALAQTRGAFGLVTISPLTGVVADDAAVYLSMELRDLAVEPVSGRLIGLLPDGSPAWVDTATGEVAPIAGAPAGWRGMADGPGDGGIWVIDTMVRQWHPQTGAWAAAQAVPEVHEDPILMGGGRDGQAVLLVNPWHRKIVSMYPESGYVSEIDWAHDDAMTWEWGFDTRRERWVGARHKLVLIDPLTGTEPVDRFAAAYGREQSDTYARLVEPMRRLRERLKLTYLYTQMVESPDLITYVLDSSTGDEHSPLMAEDILPATEVEGVARLLTGGSMHFTNLERWENWGWLKSAFAPMFAADGRVMAMAGTDFNASVIENSTRRALLMVFLVGAATLVLASGWSLTISRWLRRPVEALKRGALSMAAGDFQVLEVKGSREVNQLAGVFNQVSDSMQQSVTNLTSEVTRLLQRRDRAEVARVFARDRDANLSFADEPEVTVLHSTYGLGGATRHGDVALVWWDMTRATTAVPSMGALCAVPGQVRARFTSLSESAAQPPRWPENVRAVLRLNLRTNQGVYWGRESTETPFARGVPTALEMGWAEFGPVLKLEEYVVKEAGT